MPAKETSVKTAKSQKAVEFTEKERSGFLTQLEITFLIFLLKKLSSAQKPLSARKLANYMSSLTGEEHSEKTILRKLKKLCLLQNDPDDTLISNTLFLTFGGTVEESTNLSSGSDSKKVQTKYYFKPLLDASDIAMICGTITSNRFLSQKEKDYLLSRQHTLTVFDGGEEINGAEMEEQAFFPTELPEKPLRSKDLSTDASRLLYHINQLYEAIEKGYQIQLIYGTYDLDEHHFRSIKFRPKNAQTPYTLNPYAMLWNNGEYYLLATHDGHENPVHFRVDRIVSVHPVILSDRPRNYQERAPLPDSLKPFFQMSGNGIGEFMPQKYTAKYPLMGIYDEEDSTACTIECTATTLSILIDTFGAECLTIRHSPLPHDASETDLHGNPQQFFAVQMREVQYDNILQFCLQHHSSLTALKPTRLVTDIARELELSLQKYRKLAK